MSLTYAFLNNAIDARRYPDYRPRIFDEAGRLMELQSVGRGITERKELQDQLTASARVIEDLYDSAPCGYVPARASDAW